MIDTTLQSTASVCAAPPVFLLLESNALIAEDIVGSLAAIGPCRTIHITRACQAAARLAGERRVSAAFLEMQYADLRGTRLERDLTGCGARIILTVGEDDEPLARSAGWGMLVRPFTEQMIRDALLRVGVNR